MKRFVAFEVSLQFIRSLRRPLAVIRRQDKKIHDQIRDAAASASLHSSEGNGRVGGDRLHLFRVSYSSAKEASAGLLTAEAWGYLSESEIRRPLEIGDRLCGFLWGLTK